MIKKSIRWAFPVIVACLLTLIYITPVLAITPPDAISIDGVWVYRNCRETGDQLYLVYFTIDDDPPPDESITEAYILRLEDNDGDEIEHTYPYTYYNKGYAEGVGALYFDADDAPEWEGICSMHLLGNPFADWEGELPEVSVPHTDFDVWQDNELGITQTIVGARVIEMALDLETDWSMDMVTVTDDGRQVLTAYAAGYFINVIPNLYEIAPDIFAEGQGGSTTVMEPEIPEEEERLDYAEELESNIIGTPFDLTNMADDFGVSRGPLTAILYYGVVVGILVYVSRLIGTYKPLMLLSIPLVILGAFIGVPLVVTIICGLVALGMTAYTIFYKPSTA